MPPYSVLAMQVEFELEGRDLAAFFDAVWRRRVTARLPARWQWLLLGGLMMLVVALGAVLSWVEGGTEWLAAPIPKTLLWVLGVVLALLAVVFASLLPLRAFGRWATVRRADARGKCTIELGNSGFVETTHRGREVVPWASISEVCVTTEQIHLHVDRFVAYLVPRRAFASGPDADRFVERVRLEIARARAGAASPGSESSGWSRLAR